MSWLASAAVLHFYNWYAIDVFNFRLDCDVILDLKLEQVKLIVKLGCVNIRLFSMLFFIAQLFIIKNFVVAKLLVNQQSAGLYSA